MSSPITTLPMDSINSIDKNPKKTTKKKTSKKKTTAKKTTAKKTSKKKTSKKKTTTNKQKNKNNNTTTTKKRKKKKKTKTPYGLQIELLVRQCQSGKTGLTLEAIGNTPPSDKRRIHFLLADNICLQAIQLSSRTKNTDRLRAATITSTYSSQPDTFRNKESAAKAIRNDNSFNVIIVCKNHRKLVSDIPFFMEEFPDVEWAFWIDEADKNLGKSFIDQVNLFRKLPSVFRIVLITSTPQSGPRGLFSVFGDIQLFALPNPHSSNYQDFASCTHIEFLSDNAGTTLDYVLDYFQTPSNHPEPGQVWLIPAERRTVAHDLLKDGLFQHNFFDSILVINSKTKGVFQKNPAGVINFIPMSSIPNAHSTEMSTWLGEYYRDQQLSTQRLAIVGCECVNRGISIKSPLMPITHAVFSPKFCPMTKISGANAYQGAARVCGNSQDWNQPIPTVISTSEFRTRVEFMEKVANDLATLASKKKPPLIALQSILDIFDAHSDRIKFTLSFVKFRTWKELVHHLRLADPDHPELSSSHIPKLARLQIPNKPKHSSSTSLIETKIGSTTQVWSWKDAKSAFRKIRHLPSLLPPRYTKHLHSLTTGQHISLTPKIVYNNTNDTHTKRFILPIATIS